MRARADSAQVPHILNTYDKQIVEQCERINREDNRLAICFID